jgi:hypothetical protein
MRLAVGVAVAALAVTTIPALAAAPSATPRPAVRPTLVGAPTAAWGVAGGYTGLSYTTLRASGARFALAEVQWAQVEPAPGRFDRAYLDQVLRNIRAMKAAGLQVELNIGLDVAPSWLLKKPGARFVDQHGRIYRATPEPNLVWDAHLRAYAASYIQRLFATLGTGFSVVRVGGGHWGELTYPRELTASGRVTDSYWAFDRAARSQSPTPKWRPGMKGSTATATRFLNWYLDSLVRYQNWQVQTVQRWYRGRVAVLYPSWGMRAGDFAAAVRTRLNGTSSAERNGEVQSGIDHERQIKHLASRSVAVWCTWGDAPSMPGNISPADELARLARATHRPFMLENTGSDVSVAAMMRLRAAAIRNSANDVLWVRAANLLAGSRALGRTTRQSNTRASAGLADFAWAASHP